MNSEEITLLKKILVSADALYDLTYHCDPKGEPDLAEALMRLETALSVAKGRIRQTINRHKPLPTKKLHD